MNYLVFDTETTGLVDWHKPPEDPSQPDILEFAAVLLRHDTVAGTWRKLNIVSLLVQTTKEIPAEAVAVHGIDNEVITWGGVLPSTIPSLWLRLKNHANAVVAHNASFDLFLLKSMFARYNMQWEEPSHVICTMKASTNICKLPGKKGYKWPTLAEACRHFFGDVPQGLHRALDDVMATGQILQQLVEKGVV